MAKILTVDIGAGTMDILHYDTESGDHYKAVVRSPVAGIAERAESADGELLIVGSEMGGGEVSRVLKDRARKTNVIMSFSAARTIHHDPDRVRSFGIQVVEDEVAGEMERSGEFTVLTFGDLEIDRLERIVSGIGVSFSFDVVGVCAQDHGVAPKGVSQLDHRHDQFAAVLAQTPFPDALLFEGGSVPRTMSRLRSIAESAAALPTDEVFVMDSGMAAILGASMDPRAVGKERLLVVDIATSHTVGAAVQDGELDGFFEYHTRDITLDRLETLLRELCDGKIEHAQIISEGGHGAYTRRAFGFDRAEIILATGPKRRLIERSSLPIALGAPLGDNMMTGTAGLLEAIRRRKRLEPGRGRAGG